MKTADLHIRKTLTEILPKPFDERFQKFTAQNYDTDNPLEAAVLKCYIFFTRYCVLHHSSDNLITCDHGVTK